MIQEDLDIFTADFGVSATSGSTTGMVILDMPDQLVAGGEVLSTDYSITYKTALFPNLTYGDAIVVNGVNYTLRETRLLGDGAFSQAGLSKT